jgi:hypothetical protein
MADSGPACLSGSRLPKAAQRIATCTLAVVSILLLSAPGRAFAGTSAKGDSPPAAARLPADSYFEAGVELHPFIIVKPTLGYWCRSFGVRIGGGYLSGNRHDLRLDLGYKFGDDGRWRHAAHLVVGQTKGSDPGADYDYSYAGLAYELNYRGFYLELGLGKDFVDRVGNLDGDPVVPVGTLLGYLYQFR